MKLIEIHCLRDLHQRKVSQMNVTFNLVDAEHDTFDAMCNDNGISGLKGHRSVGGYRASIYNSVYRKC